MAKSYGRIYQNKSNVSITPFDIYNLYPVGSIYISVNSTNPSNYFGGTWEQIKDRFLLASGNTYQAGTIGGEATHTLTVNEIPSHNHFVDFRKSKNFNTGNIYDAYFPAYATPNTWTDAPDRYTANTGGGQAHNNMPPYLAVYIWKRVA